MESTFILIKPDAVKRRLVGTIILKFEQKGLYLCNIKSLIPSNELVDKHYEEHVNKSWYPGFKNYFRSGTVVAMVFSGKNAVSEARKIIGATNPVEALPGTIRGDFALETGRNLIHGSDSCVSAKREIDLWFGDELVDNRWNDYELIYEK